MSKKFLNDETMYQFVSSEYHAKKIEEESGIEMSWASMGGSDELEEALSELSEKDQEEFEAKLEETVLAPEVAGCFEEMDELVNPDEDADNDEDNEDGSDKLERLKELQSEAMEVMKEHLKDYIK